MKYKGITYISLATLCVVLSLSLSSCSKEGSEKESDETEESVFEVKKPKAVYGKIQHVDIAPTIDQTMVTAGREIFETKCNACHKYDERYVGPALGKVTERRTPEYIMNMILDTETMINNDDTVKCLMQEFLMRMPDQNVNEKDARNVLEHLRDHAMK